MTKFRFLKTGAIGALATALLMTSLPVEAQDRGGNRGSYSQRGGRGGGENPAVSPRQSRPTTTASRGNWGGGDQSGARSQRYAPPQASQQARPPRYTAPQSNPQAAAPAPSGRNGSYTAPRNRSYGATARSGNAGAQRQQREVESRRAGAQSTTPGRQAVRQAYRAGQNADQRSDRDAYRQGYTQGRRADARDDRRDQQRAYANGYRAGDRSNDRWDNNRSRGDHRRWDNRGWRNDNRYDWHRYRAANRSLFSLGRYYSPYRNYSYSRISIGFTLGSLFYSNRYWINDPWQYRLPPVYGPYRWIRYYDDALLVDIYSGQVVDVIYDFFW